MDFQSKVVNFLNDRKKNVQQLVQQIPQPVQSFGNTLRNQTSNYLQGVQQRFNTPSKIAPPLPANNPIRSFVAPIFNEAQNYITKQAPAAQRTLGLVLNNPYQRDQSIQHYTNVFRNNSFQNSIKDVGLDLYNTGKFAANTLGGAKMLTGGLLNSVKTILPTAVISGGLNKAMGGSFLEGAGQGVAISPSIRGITGITNPFIERTTQRLAPRIAPKLTNNPIGNYLTTSTIRGAQNIPEGAAIDATLGHRPMGAMSVGLDFASGFLPGGGRVGRASNVNANAKVEPMAPKDRDFVTKTLQKMLENKDNADYQIRFRQQAEDDIRQVAEGYTNKEFAWKAPFERVAQEVFERAKIDAGERQFDLPSMGIIENGSFKPPYKSGDIQYLKKGMNDVLGTTRNDPKRSRVEELEYYAKQGDEGAQANLDLYRSIEKDLDAAKAARGNIKVRPQAQIQKEVGGNNLLLKEANRRGYNDPNPEANIWDVKQELTEETKGVSNFYKQIFDKYSANIPKGKSIRELMTSDEINTEKQLKLQAQKAIDLLTSEYQPKSSLKSQPNVAKPLLSDIEHRTNQLFDELNKIDDKLDELGVDYTKITKARRTRIDIQRDILAKQKQKLLDELDSIDSQTGGLASSVSQPDSNRLRAVPESLPLTEPSTRLTTKSIIPQFKGVQNTKGLPKAETNFPKSSTFPSSNIVPQSSSPLPQGAGKATTPQQPIAIAVSQPTELVPVANSLKSGGSLKQGSSELVPLKQSLKQQSIPSGGGQPPLQPPKQLPGGSAPIDPKSSSDGIIGSVRNKINKIYTETLDRFHPLSSIANKAGEDVAMRRALSGHYGAGSTAQYHIDFELAPILKGTDVGELRKAAIAMRDAELKSRGIKGSNTDALSELLSKQGKNGLKDPVMGESLKKLYKYQDDLVKKYLVGTGIMTQKAYNEMKSKNQFYIPFKRVMEDVDEWLGATPQKTGVGSVGSQNVIKKIKGSDRDIQDPLESIIENTYKIVGLAKRQEVAQTLASLETKLPKGTITKVFGKNLNPNNYFSVFEKGKVVHYKAPQDVIEAAKGMNQDQMSTIINILAAPTRVFRATATGLNPEFMLPNITRDLQSAFVNIGLNPTKFISGLAHYMKRDDVYQDFLKSGGLTSQVSLDRPYLKKTVGEISSNKRGISVLKGGNLFNILAKIGQASEQPTRLAAFQKSLNDSLKKGLSREDALKDAAYAAQESTVNFGRRGSKTQSVNMIYAFMNARAQGIDRIIRSVKSNPAAASTRIGMLAIAPAVGLYAYNRGFEAYNDERILPSYEKENNFIIMLSDEPISELGGAQYIKIPKGDIGKIANPIEAFMSYADGRGGDVQSSLLTTLKAFLPANNVGDVIPTALRPAVENAANYNFFMKRPIVSESKKDYPAKFQYNKNTSPIYKEIGSRLNVSPAKVENIVRGYLTGFARIGEMMVKPFDKENKYSGQDINQTPVARRFMGGAVRTEDEQALTEYYQQKGILDKVQSIKTGIKYGNIPVEDGINEINKLLENNQEELKTKPQSYLGVSSANASSEKGSINQEIQDSMLKLNVEQTGKAQLNSVGDIIYVNENGNAATIKLTPPTQGQGIGAFANRDWNITKAREIWNSNIPQELKDQSFKKLNVKAEDVRYDALANYTNDIKAQYLSSKSDTKEKLVENILSGRQRSIGDKIFASDGVIDAMVDEGRLTKAEAKYLKSIDYNKDGTLKKGTGSGGKKGTLKVDFRKLVQTSQRKTTKMTAPQLKTPFRAKKITAKKMREFSFKGKPFSLKKKYL